jgi:hypothetical protein
MAVFAVSAITDFASGLIAPLTGLAMKFIPDKDKAAQMAFEMATLAGNRHQSLMEAQLEVAKIEAGHKSLFVAGARPAIMWICGLGLGYNVLIHPILSIWFSMPPIETELLYPTLMGMLGLGTMRSFDKNNGVAREG